MRSLLTEIQNTSCKALKRTFIPIVVAISCTIFGMTYFYAKETSQVIYQNHQENLSYWLRVGDKFQIERTITNFNSSDTGWKIGLEYSNYSYPKRENLKNFGSLGFDFDFLVGEEKAKLQVIGQIPFYFLGTTCVIILSFIFFVGITWGRRIKATLIDFNRPLEDFLKNMSEVNSFENIGSKFKEYDYKELTELSKTVTEMANRVKNQENQLQEVEKERFKLDLAREVSHDIRSPVSALEMIAGDLKEKMDPDKYELFEMCVGRVKDIADRMLNETRTTHASYSTDKIEEYVTLLQDTSSEKLKISCALEEAHFNLESSRFESVISNLINNSKEAISAHGEINITGTKEDGIYSLSISDNGSGIPADVLSKIGKKGFSYGKAEGNGIGLYSAKQAIESFGGVFNIDSSFGKGTTVTINLPC